MSQKSKFKSLPEMISASQLASLWSLSIRTVRDIARKEKFRSIRPYKNKRLYFVSDVLGFVEKKLAEEMGGNSGFDVRKELDEIKVHLFCEVNEYEKCHRKKSFMGLIEDNYPDICDSVRDCPIKNPELDVVCPDNCIWLEKRLFDDSILLELIGKDINEYLKKVISFKKKKSLYPYIASLAIDLPQNF